MSECSYEIINKET